MENGSSMFGMGASRIPITTYYRTISVDNKPTTVIIGPSKHPLKKLTPLCQQGPVFQQSFPKNSLSGIYLGENINLKVRKRLLLLIFAHTCDFLWQNTYLQYTQDRQHISRSMATKKFNFLKLLFHGGFLSRFFLSKKHRIHFKKYMKIFSPPNNCADYFWLDI